MDGMGIYDMEYEIWDGMGMGMGWDGTGYSFIHSASLMCSIFSGVDPGM